MGLYYLLVVRPYPLIDPFWVGVNTIAMVGRIQTNTFHNPDFKAPIASIFLSVRRNFIDTRTLQQIEFLLFP